MFMVRYFGMTDFFFPSHIQLPWVLDRINGKLDSTRAGVLPGEFDKECL